MQGKASERKIQSAVLKYLRNLAPLGKFYKVMAANERGVPDIIGCYKGQFFAFEIKRPSEELKAIQRTQAYELTVAGGLVYRIDSVEAVMEIIQKFELERHGL